MKDIFLCPSLSFNSTRLSEKTPKPSNIIQLKHKGDQEGVSLSVTKPTLLGHMKRPFLAKFLSLIASNT